MKGRRCRRRSTRWPRAWREWDAAVSRASRPGSPAPSRARRPPRRRRCARRWPPPISIAAAWPTRCRISISAVALDPSFVAAHLLRGLAHARAEPDRGGCGGVCGRAQAGACVGPRGVSVSQRHSRGGAERGARQRRWTALRRRPSRAAALPPRADASPALPLDLLDDASVTRRSSCRRPTSRGFRLAARERQSIRRRWPACARRRPRTRWSRLRRAPDGAQIRRDERARIANADALVAIAAIAAAGARQPARHGAPRSRLGPGALAARPAGRGWRRPGGRAAVVRGGVALCAGGRRVDRATRRSAACSTPRSTSTPPRAPTSAASR